MIDDFAPFSERAAGHKEKVLVEEKLLDLLSITFDQIL